MTGDTSFIREPSMAYVYTCTYRLHTSSMGRDGTTFYKGLADQLLYKQGPVVMGLAEVSLSFAILHCVIICLRGTRWSFGQAIKEMNLTLATAEGQVPPKV